MQPSASWDLRASSKAALQLDLQGSLHQCKLLVICLSLLWLSQRILQVPEFRCRKVPSEKCTDVPIEKCQQLPEQKCTEVGIIIFWGVLENSRTPPWKFPGPDQWFFAPWKIPGPPPGKFQDPTSHKVLDISKHHPLASFTISFSTSLRELAQRQSIVHINSLSSCSFSYIGPMYCNEWRLSNVGFVLRHNFSKFLCKFLHFTLTFIDLALFNTIWFS